MIITVNALELASELAHTRTLQDSGDLCNNEDDMYITDENGDRRYTDEIQDRFGSNYDYYFKVIEECLTLTVRLNLEK